MTSIHKGTTIQELCDMVDQAEQRADRPLLDKSNAAQIVNAVVTYMANEPQWNSEALTRIVLSKMKELGVLCLLLAVLITTGCGGGSVVTKAHAQGSGLTGTYIFTSRGFINGQPFFEVGTHTFNPDGTACTNSTMNTNGKVQRMDNYCGTYTVVGLAGSGQSQYDASDFVMSADQETFYAVGTTAGGTWSAEAHRQ